MNSSLSRALLSRALAFSGTSWEQSMFGYGIKATNQCQLIDQLSQRGFVQNPSLIAAMKRIDRARFLPTGVTDSYANIPVKVSGGSSVSTPQLHAQVLELLSPALVSGARPTSFLDFGCGTGYLASVAAEMGIDRVVASECDSTAYQTALDNLAGYSNVHVLRSFPEGSYSTAKFNALYVSPYFLSSGEVQDFCSQWLHTNGLAVCSYRDCPDGLDQQLVLIHKKADRYLEIVPQFRVAGAPLEINVLDGSAEQAAPTGTETRELNKRILLEWRERFATKFGRRPTRADMFRDPAVAEAFRKFSESK